MFVARMITRSQAKKNLTSDSTDNVQFEIQENQPTNSTFKYSDEEFEVAEFLTNITKKYTEQLKSGNVSVTRNNKNDYSIYFEDITPDVEKVLEQMDKKDEDYIFEEDEYDLQKEWGGESTMDDTHYDDIGEASMECHEDDCDEDYIPTKKECDDMDEVEDMKMYYENVFIHPKTQEFIKKTAFMTQFEGEAEEDSDASSDYEYDSGDESETEQYAMLDNEDIESVATVIQDSPEDDYDSSSDYYPSDEE
jgi:hypothetical protein